MSAFSLLGRSYRPVRPAWSHPQHRLRVVCATGCTVILAARPGAAVAHTGPQFQQQGRQRRVRLPEPPV